MIFLKFSKFIVHSHNGGSEVHIIITMIISALTDE